MVLREEIKLQQITFLLLSLISSSCFFYYGLALLFSQHMRVEFERYGLSQFRRLTGVLQILGSVGLIIGLYVPTLMTLASLGLAMLMALGVLVRIRVKDPVVQMLPAFLLLLVNSIIFFLCFYDS